MTITTIPLQLVPELNKPRPLSHTERRVALAWFHGRVTVQDILTGRTRSGRGACFALVDGARNRGEHRG